jgi:hypothetical protein
MASVDGEFVGPLVLDDVAQIMQDIRAGQPVLPDKQLRHRRSADPGVGGAAARAEPPSPDGSDPLDQRAATEERAPEGASE